MELVYLQIFRKPGVTSYLNSDNTTQLLLLLPLLVTMVTVLLVTMVTVMLPRQPDGLDENAGAAGGTAGAGPGRVQGATAGDAAGVRCGPPGELHCARWVPPNIRVPNIRVLESGP